MFGWKKTPPIRTLIGEGTVIVGEIRFSDGLRIDGEVQGNVTSLGESRTMLVISEKARVSGKVRAGHVIINGYVHGLSPLKTCLNCSPKPALKAMCATKPLKCTRAPPLTVNCAP